MPLDDHLLLVELGGWADCGFGVIAAHGYLKGMSVLFENSEF